VSRSKILGGALALVLLVILGLVVSGRTGTPGAIATTPPVVSAAPAARDPESGLPFVELAALPPQARRTVELVAAGGPFPYPKDGAPFGNPERILPVKPSGFYREYTVRTPGESDRGARRIVSGDHDRQLFYTDDHYATFARIRR